uniref:Tudor-knot domain-containing protein n=1 Tax=Poecilia mexicana TaxID=48701 RepID=A0A3B3X7B8_9TELE
MKTPPDRSGITFEVGAQLEARDRQKNWYAATIEKIDYDKERVLVHYRQWSRRHNEWFHWSSPYLRPLERVKRFLRLVVFLSERRFGSLSVLLLFPGSGLRFGLQSSGLLDRLSLLPSKNPQSQQRR